MAVTRLQMQTSIYAILQKSAAAAGLLTPAKVNEAIQDSLDYISWKMMKIGGGWQTQSSFANITGGSSVVTLPTGMTIVNWVKMKDSVTSTDYVPISFDENADGVTSTANTGQQGSMSTWCFKSGALYLNNLPATSITAGILFDGVFAPTAFASDSDTFSGDFDSRVFTNYVKWRSASILRSLTTKEPAPWVGTEAEWKQAVLEYVSRRYREPGFSKSFS